MTAENHDRGMNVSRRTFLGATAATFITSASGCIVGENNPGTSGETETPSPSGELAEITHTPGELPPVWNDQSIREFLTVVTPNSNAGDISVSVRGEEVSDAIPEENGFGIIPRHLKNGENNLTVSASGQKQELTTNKKEPEVAKLDIVQRENTELRTEIREQWGEEEAEKYLNQHSVSADNPIFSSYSTPRELGYNKYPVDLTALEYWHDNDFHNLSPQYDEEMRKFVESINTEDNLFTDIENKAYRESRNNPEGWSYPNSEGESNTWGHFDFQEFSDADSAKEALDWLHPYLFAWERNNTSDVISTEDEKYAATIQESLDQYTDLDTHVWAFDLPRGAQDTHGNGFIYDQTNNELLIMETITSPRTKEREDGQLHPILRDSNYLNPDHNVYNMFWHPIRFDGTTPGNGRLDFREGKAYASSILTGIASGVQDMMDQLEDKGPALTTEYVTDRIEKLLNYNQNDFDFSQLKQESKTLVDLWTKYDNNAAVYLDDEDNMQATSGISSTTADAIWEDQSGEYDDIETILQEEPEKLA